MSRIRKDDIRDREKPLCQTRLHGSVHATVTRALHPDADHGDHDGADDGDERRNRHVGDIEQGARERADEADEHTDDSEGDRARHVVRQRVQHDAEG